MTQVAPGAASSTDLESSEPATPQPQKILVVATEWKSSHGGLSTFNRELCAALAVLGHDVNCYVPSATGDEIADAKLRGVELISPAVQVPPEAALFFRPPVQSVDVLVGHGRVTGFATMALSQNFFPSAKVVHFIHVLPEAIEWYKDSADPAETAERRQELEAGLARSATLAVGVGPLLSKRYATYLWKHQTVVSEFRPGLVETEAVDAPPPVIRCLVLGRAEDLELKGLDIASAAMGVVSKTHDANLVVRGAPAGTGKALKERLKKAAGPSRLEILVGNFTPDGGRIAEEIARSSVVLMPSRSEGYGLVALEAISAGIPVLASERSGFAQFLRNLTDCPEAQEVVVPVTEDLPRDKKVWAAAISKCLVQPSSTFAKARLVRAAIQKATTWTDSARSLMLELGKRSAPSQATPNHPPAFAGAMPTPIEAPALLSGGGSALEQSINNARDLLRQARAKQALTELEAIRRDSWQDLSTMLRRRVVANIGAAKGLLLDPQGASAAFLEALALDPEDPQTICSAAKAYVMANQPERARELLQPLLEREPGTPDGWATLIMSVPKSDSLGSVLSQVPEAMKDEPVVAWAVGRHAQLIGEWKSAVEWLTRAVQGELAESYEAKAALASALLGWAVEHGPRVDMSDERRDAAEKAVELLSTALELLAHGDMVPARVALLLQRSNVHELLDDLDRATTDASAASALDERNPRVLARRAELHIANGRPADAIRLIAREGANLGWHGRFVLARALAASGNLPGAIAMLEDVSDQTVEPELANEAGALLLRLCERAGRYRVGSARARAALERDPGDMIAAIDAARFERLAGESSENSERMSEFVRRMAELPLDVTRELADELMARGRWDIAARGYERVANTNIPSGCTRRLLHCLDKLGNLGRYLDVAQAVRRRNGPVPEITMGECAVLEEIGDLERAKEVSSELLRDAPDDAELGLRRALMAFRRGDDEEVEAYLDSLNLEDIQLHLGMRVVELMRHAGRSREAILAMYELRRRFFDDNAAHMQYVTTFFMRVRESDAGDDGFSPLSVTANCAVKLKVVEEGAETDAHWWIIEGRSAPSLAMRELSVDSELSKTLLGKGVGEHVLGRTRERIEILELKSKYVHALHESLELVETVFPPAAAFRPMRIKSRTPGGHPDFSGIIAAIKEAGEYGEAQQRYYASGTAPAAMCAQGLRRSVYDVVLGFASDPEVGIRASVGNQPEWAHAQSTLARRPRLVVEPVSLWLIQEVGIAAAIVELFGKLRVPQAVLDGIREAEAEFVGPGPEGVTTMFAAGGGVYRQEIPAEVITARATRLADLRALVRNFGEVVPCSLALRVPRARRHELWDAIGAATTDAIFVASEPNNALVADDFVLRELSGRDHGVAGVWVQPLAAACREAGSLGETGYQAAVVGLAKLNVRHVRVEARTLFFAAEEDNWRAGQSFLAVCRLLHEPTEIHGAVGIVSTFLKMAWLEKIGSVNQGMLAATVLDHLSFGRPRGNVLALLMQRVAVEFHLVPFEAKSVRRVIAAWAKAHVGR